MKRILFVLSMLIGVAYGQVTGHFRFDSTMLYKNGGNNELILLNGTRGVTGGVLTNLGNGRTAFVAPSVSIVSANNGDTVVSGSVGHGGRLVRNTTIDLNGLNYNFINKTSLSAGTLEINLNNNNGQVRLINNSGALLERGFYYEGDDVGFVSNWVHNKYAGTNSSASAGWYTTNAWGKEWQSYLGSAYNSFAPNGVMYRSTGLTRIHTDSGYISFSLGTLGGPGTGEKMRLTPTGVTIFTTLGDSNDSVRVKDNVTGVEKSVAQSSISGVNIYNTDGTLTGNRTLTRNSNSLTITNGSSGGGAFWGSTGAGLFNAVGSDNNYQSFFAYPDSAVIYSNGAIQQRWAGTNLKMYGLTRGIIDTTDNKPIARNNSTGEIVQMNSWAQVSGGSGSDWALALNAVADGNKLGSSNNRSIPFYTNGVFRGNADSAGVWNVGLGSGTFHSVYGDLRLNVEQGYSLNRGGSLLGWWRVLGDLHTEFNMRNNSLASTNFFTTSGDNYINGGELGIGTSSPTSKLHVAGSLALPYRKITADAATILATDYTLSVDNGATDWGIVLPDATTCAGRIYIIKRFDDTSTGRIDISSAGGDVQSKADGSFGASYSIGNSGAYLWGGYLSQVKYQSNGTHWEAIQ